MTAYQSGVQLLGVAGAVIFYGRFYVQLYYSERAGRSVSPAAFWYMSAAGSLSLFTYGVLRHSPLGVLAHCFNVVVYARNLVHIWREHGRLSRWRAWSANLAIVFSVGAALALLSYTWLGAIHKTQSAPVNEAAWQWFWLAVGVVGQAIFACRFAVQWAVTEMRRKSTFPALFWYLSIVASALQIAAFSSDRQWVYALGLASTIPAYVRNLWLQRRPGEAAAVA